MDLKFKKAFYSLSGEYIYIRLSDVYHSIKPLPDFLIIGTQKGGTTSLYNYLVSHPQVLSAAQKEILYFDYNFSENENWYRKFFPLLARLKRSSLTGEADPDYLYHLHAPKRIAQTTKNIKLIIILRNPVNRAISHYWYEVKGGHEKLPIHKAFDIEEERIAEGRKMVAANEHFYSFEYEHFSYLDRGKYAEQIKRYMTYFDLKQMLILKSEDLFSHTQETFNKLTSFLNLRRYELHNLKSYNTGNYQKERYTDLRNTLSGFFEPYNRELYKLLDIDPWW
jgi:hypothetical protein